MKIAFNISRMNWYRVLSPLIEEALRRRNLVECWHNAGANKLGDNRPNRHKVPKFISSQPKIIDYQRPEDIICLIEQRSPEIVIDICPPAFQELRGNDDAPGSRPFWLLVDQPPGNGLVQFQNEREVYGCDAFAFSNEHFLNSSIRYCCQDKNLLLETMRRQESELGADLVRWTRDKFMYQCGNPEIEYLKSNTILTGNPAFDKYASIDKAAVRQRLRLSEDQRVIVLLPFAFGFDQTAPWEQIFKRSSVMGRLLWVMKTGRSDYFTRSFSPPSNRAFLKSLRAFADKNDAILIAKLRHSRKPQQEIVQYCHLMVGDEGYYPHTAAELFSIANLVVGHYSSGSLEAIALDTPYMNVEIPGFPYNYYCETSVSLEYCNKWPGVVWSVGAENAIKNLPHALLDDFLMEESSRQRYLQKYASWPLGDSSSRIVDFLEQKVAHSG